MSRSAAQRMESEYNETGVADETRRAAIQGVGGFLYDGPIIAWLACAATVLAWGARWGWPIEWACHFRVQYAWVLGASALLFAVHQRWLPAAITGVGACINLGCILPLYRRDAAPRHPGTACRIFFANLLASNRSHALLRRAIRAAQPDLVILEEFTQEWLAALGDLAMDYPHSQAVILERGYGIVVFSRLPFTHAEVQYLEHAGPPPMLACVQLVNARFTVIATHPLAPTTPGRLYYRDQQLLQLVPLVLEQREPVVVVGDLNMTSWSPVFQEFLRRTKLRDSRQGLGIQPSWPVWMPPLRIPLDHCLVSDGVMVRRRRLGPHVGSDHLPIIVDLSITNTQA